MNKKKTPIAYEDIIDFFFYSTIAFVIATIVYLLYLWLIGRGG